MAFRGTTQEVDPTGRSAKDGGAKLDAGKIMASLLLDFAEALEEVAKVSTAGAEKYSRGGWQTVPNGITRYEDAKWRHILKQRTEGVFDEDFLKVGKKIRHDAQEAWNILAALTLRIRAEKAAARGEDVPAYAVDVVVARPMSVDEMLTLEPGALIRG